MGHGGTRLRTPDRDCIADERSGQAPGEVDPVASPLVGEPGSALCSPHRQAPRVASPTRAGAGPRSKTLPAAPWLGKRSRLGRLEPEEVEPRRSQRRWSRLREPGLMREELPWPSARRNSLADGSSGRILVSAPGKRPGKWTRLPTGR